MSSTQHLDGTTGYVVRNTHDVKEQVVEKTLTFKLTEDDFAQKGKLAGHLSGELHKIEAEAESVKKTWKDKVAHAEGELAGVLNTIRRREEDRVVKCIEQKDFVHNAVNYIFNGEIMFTRALEQHERQLEIVKTPTKKTTPEELGLPLKQ